MYAENWNQLSCRSVVASSVWLALCGWPLWNIVMIERLSLSTHYTNRWRFWEAATVLGKWLTLFKGARPVVAVGETIKPFAPVGRLITKQRVNRGALLLGCVSICAADFPLPVFMVAASSGRVKHAVPLLREDTDKQTEELYPTLPAPCVSLRVISLGLLWNVNVTRRLNVIWNDTSAKDTHTHSHTHSALPPRLRSLYVKFNSINQ